MIINYNKLPYLHIDRNTTVIELQKYSANVSTSIRHDEYRHLESIGKMFRVLHCKVDDSVEFIPNWKKVTENAFFRK